MPAQASHVPGIQACLRTENARSQARRDFLTWPRLVAIGESGRTRPACKDFADFSQRVKTELTALRAAGFTVYNPFAESAETVDAKPAKSQEYLDNRK